jgi:site-specific DNA recombinase
MNDRTSSPPARGPRTVSYARVSSKDQEREGFSIPSQRKLLRAYADAHGLTIVQEFVDIETAKQTGRKGFAEMLAYLRSDPSCRTILVEKTDRLYRNVRDWNTVDDLGVDVHFVKEGAIASPASRSSDKFMQGIKVLMAKQYVDNLSEEVKKGLREKAEQGHWPSVAPVGYVNNRETRRIDVDPSRGPMIATLFERYGSGDYSLKALAQQAHAFGLTHPRSGRRMMKGEIHRILQNPIYAGEFRWHGTLHQGSHAPLVSRALFDRVQAVLTRKPRARYPKQQHAFMGLLTCARCGCAMTAEKKKGKYVYYRCTGFHGRCGNTYIREERLADLLGAVVDGMQISEDMADWIAEHLRDSRCEIEEERQASMAQLIQRQRSVQAKLDRGYEDYLEGRISTAFWARKSEEWEAELATIAGEQTRIAAPSAAYVATGERILELAKNARILYKSQDPGKQRRLLETVLSNCTFDRGSLCPTYVKPFDLLAQGRETGNWRGGRDSNPRPPA